MRRSSADQQRPHHPPYQTNKNSYYLQKSNTSRLQSKQHHEMLAPVMTLGEDNEKIGWTLAERRRMAEFGRKGGLAGNPELKRQAVLRAWANPDPSKRPGRKKGRNYQKSAKTPRPPSGTNTFHDLMGELTG